MKRTFCNGFGCSELEFKEKTKFLNAVLGKSLLLKLQYVTTIIGRLLVQLESVDRSLNENTFKLLMQATKDHGTVSKALKKSLLRINDSFQQISQALTQYEQLLRCGQAETFEPRSHQQKIQESLEKATAPILVCCQFRKSCLIFLCCVFSAQNV